MKLVVKGVVTVLFLSALICHLFVPSITIDTISIILLVLCTVPWLFDYIKSLEISGIGKVELVKESEKRAIKEGAENIGISEKPDLDKKYSFTRYIESDPKLALAGLRMELEDCLRKLAKENDLDIKYAGIGRLSDELSRYQIINSRESALIKDISGVLNRAVHNQLNEKDVETATWVFNYGINLLDSLNEKS